ncbi:MAG: BMP family ABC transporter substrate-binding protein [Desulfovibrio sp.]
MGVSSAQAAYEIFKPAIMYTGTPKDSAFNETLHEGVLRYNEIGKVACREVVASPNKESYLSTLTALVKEGFSPIILPYSNEFPKVIELITENSHTRFIAIDFELDKPNVYSFRFSDHEGAFLAGILAAIKSKSQIVGYISTVDQPHMQRFYCGYMQGVAFINPDIKILYDIVGDRDGVWYDQKGAFDLAVKQIDQGADVLYGPAGNAGLGVLKAANDMGVFAIGVDFNQNGLYPDTMIGSAIKRVDHAVFASLMLMQEGVFRDNVKRLGLSQNAVDMVFSGVGEVVSEDERNKISEIKGLIQIGKIRVVDSLIEPNCTSAVSTDE